MPAPLIIIPAIPVAVKIGAGILGVVLLIVGVGALKWKTIKIAMKGKVVVALGRRNVGKTHFLQFLHHGDIPANYKLTGLARKMKMNILKLEELDIILKDTFDVEGGTNTDAFRDWEYVYNSADYVFYLFRADKFMANDAEYKKRVIMDIKQIKRWKDSKKGNVCKYHYLLGTFADYDPMYNPENHQEYCDSLRQLDEVKQICAEMDNDAIVIVGSMKTKESTSALVHVIFKHIEDYLKKKQ